MAYLKAKYFLHTTHIFSLQYVSIIFFQTNQILKYTFIISIWGEGSCAAAPFRALAVKWPLGCPPHAACCTEYGYCRPAEEWAAGNFRYSYKQQMSNYLEIDWMKKQNIFLFKKVFESLAQLAYVKRTTFLRFKMLSYLFIYYLLY